MAKKKISELESAADVTTNDLIQIVDVEDGVMAPSGTNKKITFGLFSDAIASEIPYVDGQKLVDGSVTYDKLDGVPEGNVLIGNSSSIPTPTPISGIISINSSGVTSIAALSITNNEVSNSAAISGLKVNPNFGSQRVIAYGSGGVSSNTSIGDTSLNSNTTGINNISIGQNSLSLNTTANFNVAIGVDSLKVNTIGDNNTSIGELSLTRNTTGSSNTAIGYKSIWANTTGSANTGIGFESLSANTTGSSNTAVGRNTLTSLVSFSNCSGLGYGADVTGSNQVQLGSSSTTTYAYGTVQNRSDARDKTDIRDTQLGLDFISSLRPVDYKWDMREDYRPEQPEAHPVDATEEELEEYEAKKSEWLENMKLSNITHNGSKKRNRYHHGLIAQEVKAVIEETGVDFGGFQDHSINGGDDVFSIGYGELISPLIKAVQELKARVEELESAP